MGERYLRRFLLVASSDSSVPPDQYSRSSPEDLERPASVVRTKATGDAITVSLASRLQRDFRATLQRDLVLTQIGYCPSLQSFSTL